MPSVQEAELALKEAKKQEKLAYRLKELEELVTTFQGKCFGSHTFERRSSAAYLGATYYEKFFLKDYEIYVLEWGLSLSKLNCFYKKDKNQIAYNRNIHERKLTGTNDKNASYNLYSGYSFYRKELAFAKFMELWEVGEDANIIIKNAFDNKLPNLKTETVTQGDFGYEASIETCIKDMGIEMIDFKLFPHVHNCIEYRTLPMFDKRRWLPKLYARPILEWQIKQLEKDCQSPFCTGSRYSSLQSEIKLLQDFINKNLQ